MLRLALAADLILSWSLLCRAQLVFVTLPTNQTVTEGGDVNFTCSVTVGGTPDPVRWQLRGGEGNIDQRVQLSTADIPGVISVVVIGSLRSPIMFRNVSRSLDSLFVSCLGENAQGMTVEQSDPPAALSVFYPPEYTPSASPTTILEGAHFEYTFEFAANPPPDSFMWTRNNQAISDSRVTVSARDIIIMDTVRDDSGVYQVTSSNAAGVGSASFTLSVQYAPEFATGPPPSHSQLMVGAYFTLNCTLNAANPPINSLSILMDGSPVISNDTVTVTDNVLTIPSVQRSHSGNYSCNATNTVGSVVIYTNLLVVGFPSAPRAVAASNVGPFTAQLTWTAPEDDGGISDPSWDPAVDDRENRTYLTYNVTLTNGTVTTMATTRNLSLPLSYLQHSTAYTVTVEAENVYGRGPQGTTAFTTQDSVPIIDSVEVAVPSLFEVEVNISLLTNGGQSVTQYTVEVRGTNYSVDTSEQMQVSLLVNRLSGNFTKGERFTVRAFAVNSMGTSDPVSVEVIVPFPPNITAPPTELTSTDIPVCCGGVQLNLANPDNPIDVTVLVNGTLHSTNQVMKNGSFLYIMGLQAGTEYSLRIGLSNVFGIVHFDTTVRPLLGRPSTPQVTLTPTAGSLRVQLTTMYPGTRESTLQYSISTSTSPRSRRQTGQQTLPVTDLTTPVSGSEEVALDPGTYSVNVTVTNQHGDTTSVLQEVTVPGVDNTALIIGVVVAAVILVLLIILVVFIIVLIYMKRRDTKGAVEEPKKEPMIIYRNEDADLEMTGARSEDPLAPQYEDPDSLSRKPPPAVTSKKEEAVDTQTNPSGVVYASLDFSKQQLGKKKTLLEKKKEPSEATIYSEIRRMTQLEELELKEQEAEEGEKSHSPTAIM